jgi:hypothetical protein
VLCLEGWFNWLLRREVCGTEPSPLASLISSPLRLKCLPLLGRILPRQLIKSRTPERRLIDSPLSIDRLRERRCGSFDEGGAFGPVEDSKSAPNHASKCSQRISSTLNGVPERVKAKRVGTP